MKTISNIVLVAGGTGGHIFPAQALAEEIIEQGLKPILVSDKRGKDFVFSPFDQTNTIIMDVSKSQGVLKLILSVYNAIKILKKHKAQVVIGFGGYTTLAVCLAAIILRVPLYIHEQNALIGRVNRLLCLFARGIFTSFHTTLMLKQKYQNKIHYIGGILRKDVIHELNKKTTKKDNSFNILVIGGSLGSKIITDVVPQSIIQANVGNLIVYQQARSEFIDDVKSLYESKGIISEVKSFFGNIGALLKKADLIIARAGASTIMEIAHAKKPALLIPLKIATDNHQFYNAKLLADMGAAIIIEEDNFNTSQLTLLLTDLLTNNFKLDEMKRVYNRCLTPINYNTSKSMLKIILENK